MIPERIAIFCLERHPHHNPDEEGKLIYAEIVLLDRGASPTHPLIYRLHKEALERSGELCIGQHADLIMGDVVKLDKQNKRILLTDSKEVRYRYLIAIQTETPRYAITDGEKRDKEVRGGLATLFEAIRVQNNSQELLNTDHSDLKATSDQRCNPITAANVKNLSHTTKIAPPLSPSMASTNRLSAAYKLYEVQA